jgi:hypothetical protein
MTRLKPCVSLDRELYDLIKELARSKWGIKQGNIKRYVTDAVKEKIARENIEPTPLPTQEELDEQNKKIFAEIDRRLKHT